MEGTSSDTSRKVYPKRTRITGEDAVTNILNQLDDNNEDALLSSDQESEDEYEETSTSSESEYEENESTVSMEEVVHNEEPVEELDNTNSDYENTEVGNKKKRGCPKGPLTANKNQQSENLMKALTNGMKWLAIMIYVYMNADLFRQKKLEFRLNFMNLLH